MIKSTNEAFVAAHSPLWKRQCQSADYFFSHTKLASYLPSEKAQCLVVKQVEQTRSGKVTEIKKLPKPSKKFYLAI